MSSELQSWVIVPALIFMARIIDVSIGTLRIIYVARGKKVAAPVLGFFEILIWLMAIGAIMKNLNNVACYVAYAGGFATGNWVGILIENKLALGMQVVRIITRKDASCLIEQLQAQGYGVTAIDAEGATGPVKLIFTIIKRKDLPQVVSLIDHFNHKAFYSVEDVRMAEEGTFPVTQEKERALYGKLLKMIRKGK